MSQIFLSGSSRTGTTAYYFSTSPFKGSINQSTGYVILNDKRQPLTIAEFSGNTIWVRNEENNFINLYESNFNFLTGYTTIQSSVEIVNDEQKKSLAKSAKNRISDASQKDNVFVIFEDKVIDDYFYNVSVKHTIDTLDTFNVYNNVVNSLPIQSSNTGVVFGKLEAIQQINDPKSPSERVKIPLRSVPIGIFNPSTDFPQAVSVDQNGNRLRLNFSKFANVSLHATNYFNQQSKDFDDNFLLTNTELKSIPEHYKMMTTTNENGEFIIYNVPIGNQTLIFDVDLLKQGLTKEEVALNFFPYPTDENPNIDSVPHFFSRQIPIEVFPAWGDFQTGYTEVNISANLDLRKWATYYFVPATYDSFKMEELPSRGINIPLSISVRDMTKKNMGGGYDTKKLLPSEIVQIPNNLNRDSEQELLWFDEFTQKKNTIQFRATDFSIIKLPANIYHPTMLNSIQTGKAIKLPSDTITQKEKQLKGTWFAAYQFKQFTNETTFRATGAEKRGENGVYYWRNHFDLTFPISHDKQNVTQDEKPIEIAKKHETLGKFPYEKSWSYFYPNPVKIPSVPSKLREGDYPLPKYSDGDLIGLLDKTKNAGGYGLQYTVGTNASFIINKFSSIVTKDYVYKYEQCNYIDETYGSGHNNSNKQYGYNESHVENGEEFQRVECGFSYFMRPMDWPLIKQSKVDFLNVETDKSYFVDSATKDVSLDLGLFTSQKTGRLDIYRILNPSPQNILEYNRTVNYGFFYIDLHRIFRVAGNEEKAKMTHVKSDRNPNKEDGIELGVQLSSGTNEQPFGSVIVEIKNVGDDNVFVEGDIPLKVGETLIKTYTNYNDDMKILLSNNSNYNFASSSYEEAKYEISFKPANHPTSKQNFIDKIRRVDGSFKFETVPLGGNYKTYNLFSHHVNVEAYDGGGNAFETHSVLIQGIYFNDRIRGIFFEDKELVPEYPETDRGSVFDSITIAWENRHYSKTFGNIDVSKPETMFP